MKGLGYTQSEESGGTKGENPRGRLQGQDEMIAIPTQLTGGRGDGPEIQEHVEALGVSYFLLQATHLLPEAGGCPKKLVYKSYLMI